MKLFSNICSYTYPNGLTLHVLPMPGSASLELQCAVRTGSIHEGEHLGCGLSHFLEHMLFQGCAGFPERSGSEKIERAGGSINAYTSYDRTVYYLTVPESQKEVAVELLSSMVRSPELPEKRFCEEKDVILRECDLYFDSPGTRLFLAGFEALFGDHPARVPIIGHRDLIATVTRDMAAEYHARRYTPNRCSFVAVGAVDPDWLYKKLGDLLGDWKMGALFESALPEIRGTLAPRSIETVFPDTVSQLGLLLPPISSRETVAAEVISGILAGSTGSRLVRTLELEKEIALNVDADIESFSGFSVPLISAVATPRKLDKLESALRRELEAVASGAISANELRSEKTQRYADQLRQMCSPSHIASAMVDGIMLNSDPAYAGAALEALQKLELEEVNVLAAKMLDANNFLMVKQRPEAAVSNKAAAVRKLKIDTAATGSNVQVISCSDHAIELASFALLLPGGAIRESADRMGLSHCIAHTLLSGCGKRNENRLAATLDRYGMDVSFNTGLNTFIAKMNAPRKYFAEAFKVMTEILTEPAFAPVPFEREKTRQLEKLRRRKMKPAKAAFLAGCQALFGNHPYGCGEHGTQESLRDFTPESARKFWNELFSAPDTVMGFAGDIDKENALEKAEYLNSAVNWQSSALPLPEPPRFPDESSVIELPIEREQTVVMKMLKIPALKGEVGNLFHMLNLAENGMNSPLFQRIREDQSLAYSVGTKAAGGFHPGVFAFSAATRAEKIADVEKAFDEEIARLAAEGLTEEEFCMARDAMLFRLARASESSHSLIQFTMLDLFYGEDVNVVENMTARLKNCTLDHFNAVIRESFTAPVTVTVHAGRLI